MRLGIRHKVDEAENQISDLEHKGEKKKKTNQSSKRKKNPRLPVKMKA